MINPIPKFASSYKEKWEKVFKDSTKEGFNADKAVADTWAEWFDENANQMQCMSPTTPPLLMTVSSQKTNFAPVVFTAAKTPPQAAQVLATAWQTWALGTLWTPPPPAPPFSAITSVITAPPAVAASYATLLAGLTAEMAVVPTDEASVEMKYLALGKLFYTATISLQVQFIGLTLPSPTPVPLMIPVPVL